MRVKLSRVPLSWEGVSSAYSAAEESEKEGLNLSRSCVTISLDTGEYLKVVFMETVNGENLYTVSIYAEEETLKGDNILGLYFRHLNHDWTTTVDRNVPVMSDPKDVEMLARIGKLS